MDFLKDLTSPVNVAIVVGLLAVLRAAGEGLIAVGKLKEGDDNFDKIGAGVLKVVKFVGKILAYFGLGNSKE